MKLFGALLAALMLNDSLKGALCEEKESGISLKIENYLQTQSVEIILY